MQIVLQQFNSSNILAMMVMIIFIEFKLLNVMKTRNTQLLLRVKPNIMNVLIKQIVVFSKLKVINSHHQIISLVSAYAVKIVTNSHMFGKRVVMNTYVNKILNVECLVRIHKIQITNVLNKANVNITIIQLQQDLLQLHISVQKQMLVQIHSQLLNQTINNVYYLIHVVMESKSI